MTSPKWDIKNPSCVITWISLALLDQSTKAFPRSGAVKLRRLAYWAGTAQMRGVRARTLAIQLDATFLEVSKAKYEDGATQASKKAALKDVTAALMNGDDSMAHLAVVTNRHYQFLGEAS